MADEYSQALDRKLPGARTSLSERVKFKVKPHVPLSELAAPLLQKWGK
jgi:hypothetical protein